MQISTERKKSRYSLFIIVPAIIISILSVATLTYTSSPLEPSIFQLPLIASKQLWFVIAGIVIYILMSRVDYTYLKYRPLLILIYLSTIALLVMTLIVGDEVKGAQRWLTIAGVQLQPSEFAKLTVILVTAYIMTFQNKFNEYLLALLSFGLILPMVILVYLQPHGSMSLLIILIWFVTVFFSLQEQFRNFITLLMFLLILISIWGTWTLANPLYLILCGIAIVLYIYSIFSKNTWQIFSTIVLVLAVVSGVVLSYSWNSILLPYQKERILSFVNPESVDPGSTFNVDQAKIAIGSGRILGKGFGKGTQASRDFLPEHQTDFIFASYAEQVGLVGSITLLTLFLMVFIEIFKYPIIGESNIFATTIVVALGMKLLIELFINLGTNMGITPATGIPLPLLSAGGSITLVTFFSLGLIQSIINHRIFVDN